MTVDMNKGITDIEYNNLNLPQKIYFDTGNTTEYLYDAGGAKRQVIHETKRHIPSGELSEGEEITVLPPPPIYTQTDYCGTVVYEDRKVKRILTPEGYLSPKEEVATRGIGIGTPVLIKSDYDYNYFINDYLGNVRAVLTWEEESPYVIGGSPSTYSLTQRNDYYAFGLPTLTSTHSEAQPYKREGKEYDEMHGLNTYDQGARQFNTHLPITPTPDPLAEKYYSISPYAQWANNPVRFVDPDGRDWYSYKKQYEDENGDFQTQTLYKYVRGRMSQKEMEDGGYTHLGETYRSDDTYYSLNGDKFNYSLDDYESMYIVSHISYGDMLVLGAVNAIEPSVSFWNNYGTIISSETNAAVVLSDWMSISSELKTAIKVGSRFIGGLGLLYDGYTILNDGFTVENTFNVTFDAISTFGGPIGALVGISYYGVKETSKGLIRAVNETSRGITDINTRGPAWLFNLMFNGGF